MQWLTHVCRIIIYYSSNIYYNNLYFIAGYLITNQITGFIDEIINDFTLNVSKIDYLFHRNWRIFDEILVKSRVLSEIVSRRSKRKTLKNFEYLQNGKIWVVGMRI